MKRAVLLMLMVALTFGRLGYAQQVGDNINVLPVYKSNADYIDELDYVRGDLYGNRQGEPDVAVSTLNRDHLLAVYNDFRLVDVPDDPPLPGLLASLPEEQRWTLTRYFGVPTSAFAQPAHLAGVEAGIGMSVSYDGGLTWVGGFVPGQFLGDTTPASLASPGYGLEGGSDPVLLAAPCGRFYLIWLQFIRGDVSRLMAALIQDHNDSDLEHTFTWEYSTLIAEANNASNGPFVDKPEASLTLTGATDCSEITEELNVTWTQFTGTGDLSNFQSKLLFGKSVDRARTFETTKVDDSYTDTSGTATVVDPVTNDIYVFFRSFNPPAMVMTKSRNNGRKWSKPVDLLETAPMAPFDMPTVSTQDLPFGSSIKDEIAPRANAFPTAAITPDGGTLLLAWHERVNLEGVPDPGEGPKVVLIYSTDGGSNWSDRVVVAPTHPASPSGLGYFNPDGFPVGPQIQPRLSCTAGDPNQCLAIFFESRPYAEPWSNPVNPSDWDPSTGLSADGFIGGYDRVMDVRGVLIDAPIDGAPEFNPSFQISRYSYRPLLLGEEPEETVDYVEQICPPGQECYPGLNFIGYPHTGGGTSPFIHDYLANEPMVTHVKDAESGVWRVADRPEDVPYGAAFITAFPDNRNVERPFENWDGSSLPPGTDWQAFSVYTPAGFELDASGEPVFGSCFNPGSRDQNVLTAEISLGLRLTAPTNYKPFPTGVDVIEFPMTIWNNTGQERQFELAFEGDPNASFAKDARGDYPFPLMDGAVKILPYSSSSLNVYAFDGEPVTVNVTECDFEDCDVAVANPLIGSITFNAPAYAPPGGSPSLTYTSSSVAVNPVPRNPVPRNPVPRNPVPRNPVPRNSTTNDQVPVYDVIDYSWNVTTASQDDAGTYLTIPNIDRAFQDDYIFQVFVTKPSTLHQVDGACNPSNLPLGTLVGHISDPANPVPRNPVPRNPVPRNPVPRNATLSDTLVQNTTFTMASDATASSASQLRSIDALSSEGCDPVTGGGRFGECTLFAPRRPNQVTITIRSYQINDEPTRVWNPHGDIPGFPQTLPSVIVADYWCESYADGCSFVQDGPELAPDAETADVEPTTVKVGQTVTFPVGDVGYANVGNQLAQEHRIGYYLSAVDSMTELPRNEDGTIDTTGPETVLLETVSAASLESGDPATVGSVELTIPLDIPRPDDGAGIYYLYAYIDDERVVSEINEDDNIIQGGPITVIPPNEPPTNIEFGTVVDAKEGEPVTLTVTFDDPGDTGEGYIYIWDFGDGSTCSSEGDAEGCGTTAVHTYVNDGTYTITVTIIDSGGLDGSGSLDVVVANVAPTANDDAYSTDEDTTLTVMAPGVLDNDTDPADELTGATLVSGTSNGSLNLAANGSFTYTPGTDFNGADSFTYRTSDGADDSNVASVTITVTPVNDAPLANPVTLSTPEDTAAIGSFSATDIDSAALTYSIVLGPTSGSAELGPEAGQFTYTPNPNYNGSDSFTYKANDGALDSTAATVTITVGAVNDAPVAVDDVYGTNEDLPLTVGAPGVLGNDEDVESTTLTAVLVDPPTIGVLGLNTDGSFSYSPPENFFGSVSFSYRASDGVTTSAEPATVIINVMPVNDDPVALDDAYVRTEGASLIVAAPGVLGNDSDVDGDSLSAALSVGAVNGVAVVAPDGGFTYTPNVGFFGSDSFTYVANDGSADSNIATVAIGVPYLHIGLLDPWKPPSPQPYTIKLGSAFPVRWQYADPATGLAVESSGALPEVRLRSGVNCQTGAEINGLETILTPGNSSYQYDDKTMTHQLNVDTNNLVANECYNVYNYSGVTQQLDGPFIFKMKK